MSLYENINKRKRAGTSRSKSDTTRCQSLEKHQKKG